jgi:predicted dehydrogenase
MAKKKKLKVIMAGCGGMSAAWIKPALKRKDIEFVGFMDINEQAAIDKAKKFDLNVATGTDLKKLIKETQADVVFDCTIPEAHCKVVTTALNAGCNVLGEKPMADTMPNARKMLQASVKNKKTYSVIQNYRYQSEIRTVKKFIESGKIGKVTTVLSDFFLGVHFGGFREKMDHVLLLDMAIHTFDAARFISGSDAIEVYAEDWNPKSSWFADGASASAIFTMNDGIRYVYNGSWCSEGCSTSWNSSWRIVGTKGSICWKGDGEFEAEIITEKKKNGKKVHEKKTVKVPTVKWPAGKMGHGGLMDEFLKGLEAGKKPPTDCSDNIKSLAMVHAAIESAEKGKKIKIKA